MKISNYTKLNTILFADDQVVIANSEDNLQRGLHALHQTVQTLLILLEITYYFTDNTYRQFFIIKTKCTVQCIIMACNIHALLN
jgi:hypothetical protein